MVEERRQEDVTLLDVLIDGPMPDEASAIRKFISLAAEATAWKGQPVRQEHDPPRRIVAWADLEIRQIGRGIMVRVRAPRFDSWWHDSKTWEGDPMGPLYDWLAAESDSIT